MTGKTVLPTITARAEAQEEADHLNVINQAVIGTKEGAKDAIMKLFGSNITNTILRTPNGSNHKGINNLMLFDVIKLFGSNITNAILRTPNGSNHKGINDLMLFNVMQAAIDGANCPPTNDVLEQLLKVINHNQISV